MLSVLLVLVAQSINDDPVIRPIPEPTPIVRPATPAATFTLDAAAVAKLANSQGTKPAARPRKLIVYSLPDDQCPPCKGMRAEVGNGDGELIVEWVKENHPAWVSQTGVPVTFDAERNLYNRDRRTLASLREWVGLPSVRPVASSEPLTVGTVDRKTITSVLETVRTFAGDRAAITVQHGGKGWLDLGPVGVLIPNGCTATLTTEPTAARITFTGTKPRVRLIAVDQPVSAVSYRDGKLTVDWDSWLLRDAVWEVK